VTGDTPSPLPAVLGHEGAGVVERVGRGVSTVAPGEHVVLSWLPSCGRCARCTSGRPTLCEVAGPALLAGTLLDGTTRLSLNGRPVHHYSFLSTFAERTVVPEASCVRIRKDAPFPIAALVGCAVTTGVGAVLNRSKQVAVLPAEAEALAEVGADLVAVQQLDPVTALGQGGGELGRDGRLARAGQAGEPEHEAGLVGHGTVRLSLMGGQER